MAHSSFGFRYSFGFCHSSFGFENLVAWRSGVTFGQTNLDMNLIQAVGIGLSLTCLLQCVAATGVQTVPIRSLKKGAFSGIREVKQEVVKSADAWEKVWKQH